MPTRQKTTDPVVTDDVAPDPDDNPPETTDESGDPTAEYRRRGWTHDADTDTWYDENGDAVDMIVHFERVVDSAGTVHQKPHGPMPVTEWPRYEKEHKL